MSTVIVICPLTSFDKNKKAPDGRRSGAKLHARECKKGVQNTLHYKISPSSQKLAKVFAPIFTHNCEDAVRTVNVDNFGVTIIDKTIVCALNGDVCA